MWINRIVFYFISCNFKDLGIPTYVCFYYIKLQFAGIKKKEIMTCWKVDSNQTNWLQSTYTGDVIWSPIKYENSRVTFQAPHLFVSISIEMMD